MTAARWWTGAVLVVGLATYTVLPMVPTLPVLAVVNLAVSATFALTAVVLAGVDGQRPNARLTLAIAVAWAVGDLGTHLVGPLPLIEFVGLSLAYAGLAALILRYPEPRLRHASERLLVLAVVGWTVVGRAVWATVSVPSDHGYAAPGVWWPTLTTGPQEVVGEIVDVGSGVLVVAFLVAITRRFVESRGLDRPVVVPVVVASVALAVAVGADVATRLLPDDAAVVVAVLVAEGLAILTVPGAFLVSAFRRRLEQTAVVAMVTSLRRPAPPAVVQEELRATLRDPDLRLCFRRPPPEDDHVGVDGLPLTVPGPDDPDHLVQPVLAADGSALGVVVADGSLRRHRGFVEAALSAAAFALENAQLQALVTAQLEEVRSSRARIVEAGVSERRQVERDLHDGVQQRILALKLRLGAARPRASTPADREVLDEARRELDSSLADLRSIARGIHPALLTSAGLPGALQALAERMPLEVALEVPARRFEPAVEATAYYVVCEALTNAIKHADADRAAVRVTHDDGRVRVVVHDDGAGGAQLKEGGGLVGLRDRVSALGGDLDLASDAATGTAITVTMPCG